MQQFTGIQYLYIDLANNFGMDKYKWDERIEWASSKSIKQLKKQIPNADNPILFAKAIRALKAAKTGEPTGFIMSLDATASGMQLMSCLTGCVKTAKATNVINQGKRMDVYSEMATHMNKGKGKKYPRIVLKDALMTVFYGSKAEPKKAFGEGTKALKNFYATANRRFPGAMRALKNIQMAWQPYALVHRFTMPDGHIIVAKVMQPIDKKIEVAEFYKATFTYRTMLNEGTEFGISLAANVIHAVDGYVVREMIRRCKKSGFQLAAIHDSFWASPNNMNDVRYHYKSILAEIADSNLLQNILREASQNPKLKFKKECKKMGKLIRKSNYALS